MQAKRIAVNEDDIGVNANVTVALSAPTDPREEINFHNIWGSVTVEAIISTANVQGTWVLMIVRENVSTPNMTDAVLNGETWNSIIIACGVFSASNESPWTSEAIHPSTSRTLNPGDSLVLQCVVTGASAGTASCRVMLCAHTTRK